MNQRNASMTVIGAGSYGTALAITLARNGHEVVLWGHDPEHIATLERDRCNAAFLPDVPFPDTLHLESDLATALAASRNILVVVPSHVFGEVLRQIKPLMRPDARLVWATKGLEAETGRLLQDVAREALGDQIPLAVISGPTFAKELAAGLPTAISLASTDQTFADDLQQLLHCGKSFRVYSNPDFIGVQLGGAVKNVIAIGAGMSDGIGFGANARTALITRGLAEMSRLGVEFYSKDIPGGQLLGPTYDYTHRLLDFTLLANGETPTLTTADSEQQPSPHVFSLLARQGLAKFEEDSGAQPDDITRTPPVYPCSRSSRLQQLMRGDEGYLLALAYSTQRGYGRNHPFAGEIRSGYIDIFIVPEELGFAVNVGELLMTECEMVNGFIDPPDEPPHFTRGYGLVFGMSERKAMAMALVDRALQAPEYGEYATGPAQDEEFVLAHADNVEAAGFVSHLKLPHYVDFQAELELLKRLQQEQNHG